MMLFSTIKNTKPRRATLSARRRDRNGVRSNAGHEKDVAAEPKDAETTMTTVRDGKVYIPVEDVRVETRCSICMGIIKRTKTVMPCLHRFCAPCIESSLRNVNHECPTCRSHITSKRSLRFDESFDELIRAVFGDIDVFEKQESEALDERKALEEFRKQHEARIAEQRRKAREMLEQREQDEQKKRSESRANKVSTKRARKETDDDIDVDENAVYTGDGHKQRVSVRASRASRAARGGEAGPAVDRDDHEIDASKEPTTRRPKVSIKANETPVTLNVTQGGVRVKIKPSPHSRRHRNQAPDGDTTMTKAEEEAAVAAAAAAAAEAEAAAAEASDAARKAEHHSRAVIQRNKAIAARVKATESTLEPFVRPPFYVPTDRPDLVQRVDGASWPNATECLWRPITANVHVILQPVPQDVDEHRNDVPAEQRSTTTPKLDTLARVFPRHISCSSTMRIRDLRVYLGSKLREWNAAAAETNPDASLAAETEIIYPRLGGFNRGSGITVYANDEDLIIDLFSSWTTGSDLELYYSVHE